MHCMALGLPIPPSLPTLVKGNLHLLCEALRNLKHLVLLISAAFSAWWHVRHFRCAKASKP